jgi:hypothetical protein
MDLLSGKYHLGGAFTSNFLVVVGLIIDVGFSHRAGMDTAPRK